MAKNVSCTLAGCTCNEIPDSTGFVEPISKPEKPLTEKRFTKKVDRLLERCVSELNALQYEFDDSLLDYEIRPAKKLSIASDVLRGLTAL